MADTALKTDRPKSDVVAWPLSDDVVIHARVVNIQGVMALDIRDFFPATNTYGRGGLLPLDGAKSFLREVISNLLD